MVWLAVPALILGSMSCVRHSDGDSATGSSETVRGLLQEVNAKSLFELDSFTLMDVGGVRWSFDAQGKSWGELTPSHLREHMVLGLPVTVRFHRENGVLIVDAIDD